MLHSLQASIQDSGCGALGLYFRFGVSDTVWMQLGTELAADREVQIDGGFLVDARNEA